MPQAAWLCSVCVFQNNRTVWPPLLLSVPVNTFSLPPRPHKWVTARSRLSRYCLFALLLSPDVVINPWCIHVRIVVSGWFSHLKLMSFRVIISIKSILWYETKYLSTEVQFWPLKVYLLAIISTYPPQVLYFLIITGVLKAQIVIKILEFSCILIYINIRAFWSKVLWFWIDYVSITQPKNNLQTGFFIPGDAPHPLSVYTVF